MKKQNRICKNCDFSKIIKTGKKYHSQSASFYYKKNQNHSFRIGISVSKKISKLAVVRNKIKRQVVASFILNKYCSQFDIVVIVKNEILKKDFNQIDQEIKKFIKFINERGCNEE